VLYGDCLPLCAREHLLFSLTHTLTITITCPCCYDEFKGTQDLKIYSYADSQILSLCDPRGCSVISLYHRLYIGVLGTVVVLTTSQLTIDGQETDWVWPPDRCARVV